jgi:polysaccharide biosynthesis transport protein
MGYSPSNYSAPLPGYGTSLIDRINIYLRIRRYFKFLVERWLLLVVFTVVGLGIGVWWAIMQPDYYRSDSVLAFAPRIEMSRGDARVDDLSADQAMQKIQSATVIQRVNSKLQEGRDNQFKFSMPTLKVEMRRGNTFILGVTSTNFEYASEFARTWAEEFLEFHKQERKALVGTTEAKFQQQILTYENKLEKAESALDDFRKKNNIASVQDAGVSAQLRLDKKKAEFEALKMELTLAEAATAEALASGAVSSGSDGNSSVSSTGQTALGNDNIFSRITAGSRYNELRSSIHNLERQIAEQSKDLKPKHPVLVEMNRQLDLAKSQLKLELSFVEERRQDMIKTRRFQIPGLQKIIEELTTEVQESTDLKNQLMRLQEDRDLIKSNLDILNRNLQSMGRVGAEEERFTIISRGVGDSRPVGPMRPQIIAMGAGSGFALALGLMFLLHKLDDRLENPEDIEAKLEEPVLGQLPEVDKKHNPEGYLLLTRMKAHTMFAESLRGIRSALLLGPEGATKRVLAVTSAVPGDGKTTFTTNFALTIAAAGNRTLLVDADLRRGNIHGYFEQPLEGGLAEVLDGRLEIKDAIHETSIKNLYFMRAGERPANPSELLIGPKTRELIASLRKEFDYVIFDCPPLTAIDDTFSVAAYLDGLLFVVRAGRTSMRFAKIGLNTIHQRSAPLLGLVINGVPIDNPYYYYTSYYYASYYHRPLTPEEDEGKESVSRRAPKKETLEVTPVDASKDGQ